MSKRKGFTLIELLVVIAIIALLLSIVMPSLRKAKVQAQSVVCKSNLKQWGVIWYMYTEDNDSRFPPGIWSGPKGYWMEAVRAHYADPKIRRCPVASNPYYTSGGAKDPWGPWPESSAWKIKGDYGSYGANGWAADVKFDDVQFYGEKRFWRRTTEGTSNTPLMGDSIHCDGRPLDADNPPEYDGDTRYTVPSPSHETETIRRFSLNRHDGTVGMLFMDHSVKSTYLKELWTLKWHQSFNTANQWTLAGGATTDKWANWGDGWMTQMKDF